MIKTVIAMFGLVFIDVFLEKADFKYSRYCNNLGPQDLNRPPPLCALCIVQFVKDSLSYNPRNGRISEAFLKWSRIHAKLKEFCREKTELINYARGRFGLVEKPPAAP